MRAASLCHAIVSLLMTLSPAVVMAEGLRVAPVLLEVSAPGASTTLTLTNDNDQPITVQARIFRWQQSGGAEEEVRTRDVVVSPPMTQLAPGAQQTIRVLRTAKSAVTGEEAYRLVIDEVPDQTRRQGGIVAFSTRLRIPVFFVAQSATLPDVNYSLRNNNGQAVLVARNDGQMRLRLSNLRLAKGGSTLERQDGLVGYVLGGSVMQWPLGSASHFGSGRLRLEATTSLGDIQADVTQN